MPVKKTPDGRIIEEKTKQVSPRGNQGRTLLSSGGAAAKPTPSDSFDNKTRIMRPDGQSGSSGREDVTGRAEYEGGGASTQRPGGPSTIPSASPRAPKTQLLRPGNVDDEATLAESSDPVTGWLVVESGPGRGHSIQVGSGMNTVGRGQDQRISLPYGDTTISSAKHCMISYDPRSHHFGLHLGDGANLTYVNGEPVYGSVDLPNFARIEIGATKLRFVALCGDNFSWGNDA